MWRNRAANRLPCVIVSASKGSRPALDRAGAEKIPYPLDFFEVQKEVVLYGGPFVLDHLGKLFLSEFIDQDFDSRFEFVVATPEAVVNAENRFRIKTTSAFSRRTGVSWRR
ncbi:hypothetical protein ACWJKU_03375 [Methylocaldum sp. MU1018]